MLRSALKGLLLLVATFESSGSYAAEYLVGRFYGSGRYVMEVPSEISKCDPKIQTHAYYAYVDADKAWRAANTGASGKSVPWFRPAASLKVLAPPEVTALAQKFKYVIGPSGGTQVELTPYVQASESHTPCWILATKNWRSNRVQPELVSYAVATAKPSKARIRSVPNASYREGVSVDGQQEFSASLARVPELAKEFDSFFRNEFGRPLAWKLIGLQSFKATSMGRKNDYFAATIDSEVTGRSISTIVNSTLGRVCWIVHIEGEDQHWSKEVQVLVKNLTGNFDGWIVKNHYYEGSTTEVSAPKEVGGKCELRTLVQTGYSGL